MMNNLKIDSIFIRISAFLMVLHSCGNSAEENIPARETSRFLNTDARLVYQIYQPTAINPETIAIDSLFVQVAYELKPERLLIIGKSLRDYPDGLKLLLVNPLADYKLLYRSRGAWESWILHPTLFKVDKPDLPLVILAAQGTSDSWGQQVFIMESDSIIEIGFMDVTRKEQADTSFYEGGFRLTDIGPFTEITSSGKGLEFRFKTDSVFYYGRIGEQVDITFAGDALEYFYDGDSLRMVLKK